MKRIISILAALALVLGFSLVATMPVAAATLNVPGGYATIQAAVAAASAGDTIQVAAGTYLEPSQTIITQDVTIIGADKTTTIIKKAGGFSGSYFFRVTGGRLSLSKVTLDGEGNLYGGVRLASPGTATISDNIFQNIVSTSYTGFGVVAYASDMIVSNNIFTNIGRVGIWVGQGNNNLVTGNTYTGKGGGDWLDYGVEVGIGGVASITGNTITSCTGVASSDGSTSAGILVSTYYGAGTTATITGNTLTGNTEGIAVGYDASDTSTVVAHYNDIYGNTANGIGTTAPTVDARYNWWGHNGGPGGGVNDPVTGTPANGSGNNVSANVRFDPWTQNTAAATGTGTADFTPSYGTISGLTSVSEGTLPTAGKPRLSFPHGFFSFTITGLSSPGQTVNVTITLPPGSAPTQYWKYHVPEGWIQIPMTVVGPPNVISITLVDGGLGDDDGAANGVIDDQGAPGSGAVGWETYPISKVRVLLPWIALLAAIMAGVSLLVVRRRRTQS